MPEPILDSQALEDEDHVSELEKSSDELVESETEDERHVVKPREVRHEPKKRKKKAG